MPPRSGARDVAVVLFCLIGIGLLNDFSHNRYRGLSDPRPVLAKMLGLAGPQEMNLYELLTAYTNDREATERIKAIATVGYILRQKAIDPRTGEVEKVGKTFRLARRFSDTGLVEGSHVISVPVVSEKYLDLEPGVWVRVQGKVVADPNSADPSKPGPMIQATSVTEVDKPSEEEEILTPAGIPRLPEAPEEHEHAH